MNKQRTKKFFEDAMFSNLTAPSAVGDVNRLLNSIGKNYTDSHFLESVIGIGTRWDGKLEIALDEEFVCNTGCNALHEKVCNKFYLGSHTLQVYKRKRTDIHLQSGTAVGHQSLASTGDYGTAGGLLLSSKDGVNARLFSNNHVLANSNRGQKGDFIYQYRNNYPEIIGRLENFLRIYSGIPNRLDLAVASLDYNVELYASRYFNSRRARLGEKVAKTGATTGKRYGFVASVDYTDKVKYPGFNAIFVDQTQIYGMNKLSFSEGGDSGSLIFSEADDAFVGLLFAGGAHGTIANPADLVYKQLQEWKYVK